MGETPAVHRRRLARAGVVASVLALVMAMATAACSGGDDGAADATTTTAALGGSFDVLTYNVAGLPQEISEEQPSTHIPMISPLLDAYDVVLTQEDFDWWQGDLVEGLDFTHYHERLRADAHHEHRSPKHPGPEAAGIDPAERPTLNIGDGLGYLSTIPLDGYERHAWTDCYGGFDTSDHGAADCLAMKGFAVATMTLPGGGLVDVYDLHVEAGGSDRDQELQQDDVDQLAAFMETHSKGRAIIFGGDTNLHTDTVHPDSSKGADIGIWQGFIERVGLTDSCVEQKCPKPESIDKIAYRDGEGVDLSTTSWDKPAERFSDPAGEDLSDHEPLVVGFRWTPT